jgi:hypothetical protein
MSCILSRTECTLILISTNSQPLDWYRAIGLRFRWTSTSPKSPIHWQPFDLFAQYTWRRWTVWSRALFLLVLNFASRRNGHWPPLFRIFTIQLRQIKVLVTAFSGSYRGHLETAGTLDNQTSTPAIRPLVWNPCPNHLEKHVINRPTTIPVQRSMVTRG